MPNSDQRPKITVEDLLHLKRAERPAAEFWTNFELELRQKQLTALLEKRPWWQGLPQLLTRRAYLPVGATAILAFTLVSVKYYAPLQVASAVSTLAANSAVAGRLPVAAPAVALVSIPAAAPVVEHVEPSVPVADDSNPAAVAVVATPAPAANTEFMSAMIAPPPAETPSSRSIAANLARLEQSEPEMVNAVLGSRLSPPARVQTASVSELASVPTDLSKRSRILAQYSDRPLSPEPTAPEIVRERLARRLVDTEITERLSRIGLKGDQVSLGLTLRL